MPDKTYALLVGINDYGAAVGRLRGCVSDVDGFHAYLGDRVGHDALRVEVLKDADATRANVIDGFRNHLSKATAADTVVFQFCGHGARWASAAAFHEFYPDGKDEGLVCYDSRGAAGAYDLADKELAVLLTEVARNEPHIAVILDCCHSGSGTRGVDDFEHFKARVTHEVFDERPLDTYANGYYAGMQARGEPLAIPTSRHALLSACRRDQKAWESRERRGVFTSTLLEVLEKGGADVTYAELFTRCRAAVLRRAREQTPQLETAGDFDAYAGFLGGAARRPDELRCRVFFDDAAAAWKIDRGVLQGVPNDPDQAVSVEVHDQGRPLGTARTRRVGLQESTVEFAGDRSKRYDGDITSLPATPLLIAVEGSDAERQAVAEALAARPWLPVTPIEIPAGVRYSLTAENGELWLKHRDAGVRIQGVDDTTQEAVELLVPALHNVSRWERGLALDNPSTRIDRSRVDLSFDEVLPDGTEHRYPGGEIVLDFVESAGAWPQLRARVRARNRFSQRLHFALVYFSRAYGIHILRNEPLEPGDSYATLWGEGPDDAFYVPEGIDETLDIFKVIVSTEEVDDFLLAQRPLRLGARLTTAGQARDIGGIGEQPERDKIDHDWFTSTLSIRTVRQLARVGGRDAKLAGGRIKVMAHPTVSANLNLTAPSSGARGAGAAPVPFLEKHDLQLVNFSTTRGAAASVLEITDVQGAADLAAHPLQIDLEVPLEDDEYLLPLVFDGHHFLLGGDASRDADGRTRVLIDRVPEIEEADAEDQRRSVGKALKLYFFKTYLKRPCVNALRWVEFAPDGSPRRRDDDVAAKVRDAGDVLLLIHGIIGDSENIAAGARLAGLHERVDLVLTYDYENLNAPISETAADLGRQLRDAGLHADDDKRLSILAHSMGGLVARDFIERQRGNAVVDHLVMCGTPNHGSPFGKLGTVRNVMNVLTTMALNAVPGFAAAGGAILSVLNRSKKLTVTLEQMSAASPFLEELNDSDDPGVRYTVIAGDIRDFHEESDRFLPRLVEKAGRGLLLEKLYGGEGHDIAVSAASIRGIDDGRCPEPVKHVVACHHLNYFASDAGIAALERVDR